MALPWLTTPSWAIGIYYNLDEFTWNADPSTTTRWLAQNFTTGGIAYTLDDVTLNISRGGGTSNPIAEIWSDSGAGTPGAALFSLIASGIGSGTLSDITFNPAGTENLNANSSYWVVLKSSNADTTYYWSYTKSQTGTGIGFSTKWGGSMNSGGTWDVYTSDPYHMQVQVSAIPEPEEVGVCVGAALVGTAAFLRRRKRG